MRLIVFAALACFALAEDPLLAAAREIAARGGTPTDAAILDELEAGQVTAEVKSGVSSDVYSVRVKWTGEPSKAALLCNAVYTGNVAAVRQLVNSDKNFEFQLCDGIITPLELAKEKGWDDVVLALKPLS
jgi:hypothetical protein